MHQTPQHVMPGATTGAPARHRPAAPGRRLELVRACLEQLWRVAQARGIGALDVDALRPHIGDVGRAANEVALPIEQLLLMVKDGWMSLPEVRTAPDPRQVHADLARIVTITIHSYYGD